MELSTTIPALLRAQCDAHREEIIFRKKDRGIWNAITWSQLNTRVQEIGQGFWQSGLRPGAVVAIISETRPEFVYIDLAVQSLGAVSMAIPTSAEPNDLIAILKQTHTTLLVVEGEEQLDKFLGVWTACPEVERVVIIDMKGLRDFHDPRSLSLAGLITLGENASDWDEATSAVTPDQIATIIVLLEGPCVAVNHQTLLRKAREAGELLGAKPGDERLVVLPMYDPAERTLGLYLALKYRVVSNYLENPETATENLREVKPTIFGANMEAWERLYERITNLARSATWVQKQLYQWAMTAHMQGGLGQTLANFLVLPAIRSELGFGNLRVAFVSDGVLPEKCAEWAKALGVDLKEVQHLLK